mmetsp:Transcript_13214/g.27930  ORF Transcript_13214/g.27930 Transcript_13214/m.27930 type:complete len:459 (-) Transcript_13214:251-1627(-)
MNQSKKQKIPPRLRHEGVGLGRPRSEGPPRLQPDLPCGVVQASLELAADKVKVRVNGVVREVLQEGEALQRAPLQPQGLRLAAGAARHGRLRDQGARQSLHRLLDVILHRLLHLLLAQGLLQQRQVRAQRLAHERRRLLGKPKPVMSIPILPLPQEGEEKGDRVHEVGHNVPRVRAEDGEVDAGDQRGEDLVQAEDDGGAVAALPAPPELRQDLGAEAREELLAPEELGLPVPHVRDPVLLGGDGHGKGLPEAGTERGAPLLPLRAFAEEREHPVEELVDLGVLLHGEGPCDPGLRGEADHEAALLLAGRQVAPEDLRHQGHHHRVQLRAVHLIDEASEGGGHLPGQGQAPRGDDAFQHRVQDVLHALLDRLQGLERVQDGPGEQAPEIFREARHSRQRRASPCAPLLLRPAQQQGQAGGAIFVPLFLQEQVHGRLGVGPLHVLSAEQDGVAHAPQHM